MRLLVFASYFPPHVGGLEAYVRDLNVELLELGLVEEITVLAPRLPADAQERERPGERYAVFRYPAVDVIPNFPCPSAWRPGLWQTARAATAGRRHDLVVSHTRFFLSSAAALAYSRAARLPLLHVEHGSDFVHLSSRAATAVARGYDQTLGRAVLRRAESVVAISAAAADFVERLSGRSATVVHRGLDMERYDRVEPSAELRELSGGRPVISFVGRLIDGKGVTDLVEAFAALEPADALLCLVGDGPRRADLEAQARRLGIAERCRFLGYRPEEQALALIRASDVVVNPSYTEGLPTSVLEAAALGRAIVATDVGGTAEVVVPGAGGVLVNAHDPAALSAALRDLLGDAARRERLGAAARAHVIAGFDRVRAAERFAEVAREAARA